MFQHLSIIRTISAITIILASAFANAQASGICMDPMHDNDICQRMRHLKATINGVDAQRDLVVINYPYMEALAANMRENGSAMLQHLEDSNSSHAKGIRNLVFLATQMQQTAIDKDPETFTRANLIRNNCMTCHAADNPTSGVKWNEVFKRDWAQITVGCNSEGRNPYLCKSMNGMVTAYGQMITAYVAGITDYRLTEMSSLEVVRILQSLKMNNYVHMQEDIRKEAEDRATEIAALAKAQNPEVFEKSFELPNSCMHCHESIGGSGMGNNFNKFPSLGHRL